MRKNLPLIFAVLALAGILGYLKYNKSQSNFEEIHNRVADIKQRGSISISDKYGNKTILAKKDGKWRVNDSFYAEKDKMLSLLNTLNKLQIEMPVGDSMRKVAIQDLRMLGVEVSIKDNDGEEIKTIFVGSQMGAGNYMILSENGVVSPNPYIVKVPGVKSTDLKYRFTAIPNAWYSTEVFSTAIDRIKTIKVLYHERPEFSFTLTKDEEIIKIDPLLDSIRIDKPLNKEHVVQFLIEFESKNIESRLKKDKVVATYKRDRNQFGKQK